MAGPHPGSDGRTTWPLPLRRKIPRPARTRSIEKAAPRLLPLRTRPPWQHPRNDPAPHEVSRLLITLHAPILLRNRLAGHLHALLQLRRLNHRRMLPKAKDPSLSTSSRLFSVIVMVSPPVGWSSSLWLACHVRPRTSSAPQASNSITPSCLSLPLEYCHAHLTGASR